MDMSKICKVIKQLRQSRGLSQDQVAKKLGITAPAFSKIEAGITDINISRLEQIANFFNMELTDLMIKSNEDDRLKQEEYKQELKDNIEKTKLEVIHLQKKLIDRLEKAD
ncbi:MAG: helix-turn-helix domain-containing protein [Solitalea-like symbiont of Acarus siro]